MNLNLDLWIAMAGAALFFHYAGVQKVHPAYYVMASVSVSALVMLFLAADWMILLGSQFALWALLTAIHRSRN